MNLLHRDPVTGRRLLVNRLALVTVLLVLVLFLVVVVTLGPRDVPRRAPFVAHSFITPYDTINGEPITDPSLIQRIEQIAAGVPKDLLAAHPRGTHIRYVAQSFGAGDDAPIYQGVFRDPAAALAFGCALDDDLSNRCGITAAAGGLAVFEADVPGVRCQPLRAALGAPAYEPERCEADDSTAPAAPSLNASLHVLAR